MKKIILKILFVVFIISSLNHQTQGQSFKKGYAKLIDSAFVLRKYKKYMEGVALIQQAIQIDSSAKYWAYLHIANFASLAHNNDTAFIYLNKVLHSPIAGNVSWKYYARHGLKQLQSDQRWLHFKHSIDSMKASKTAKALAKKNKAIEIQQRIENYSKQHLLPKTWELLIARQLYDSLRSCKNNYPYKVSSHYLCFYTSLNDTFRTCYLIQVPKHFDYRKRYPLVVVLHGAVRHNHPPQYADSTILMRNSFFKKCARLSDSLHFITVFPSASPQYNWMTSDKGFPLVPKIIRNLKKCFNIDDSRIYIIGHSNGATGSFNYLVKAPTLFAAFSGMNNKPVVMTGGTFIKNAINRNFYNISTDKDYYFPLEGHIKLAKKADSLGIEWHNEVYYGFPHWFPKFQQSEKAFEHIFVFMSRHVRNPFHYHIYWQCDDVKHGRCDWLEINQLDTTKAPAEWQKPINFTVSHWINVHDTSKIIDSTVQAFNFPRKSGAVQANYNNNTFSLKTSCVDSFTLYLSPKMIDFNRPIQVFVNGKKIFDKKMDFDKKFMLDNFRRNFDRQAIWVNKITLSVE